MLLKTVFIFVLLSFNKVHNHPLSSLARIVECYYCPAKESSSSSKKECYKVPGGSNLHWCCNCKAGFFAVKPCRFGEPSTTICTSCPPGTYTPEYNNKTECFKSRQSCEDLPQSVLVRGNASVNNKCVCKVGAYSKDPEKSGCKPHSVCPEGTGVLTPGNSTHDVICGTCKDDGCSETMNRGAVVGIVLGLLIVCGLSVAVALIFLLRKKSYRGLRPQPGYRYVDNTRMHSEAFLAECSCNDAATPMEGETNYAREQESLTVCNAQLAGGYGSQTSKIEDSIDEATQTASETSYARKQDPKKENKKLYEAILICISTMGRRRAISFFEHSLCLDLRYIDSAISDENIAQRVCVSEVRGEASSRGSKQEWGLHILLEHLEREKSTQSVGTALDRIGLMLSSYRAASKSLISEVEHSRYFSFRPQTSPNSALQRPRPIPSLRQKKSLKKYSGDNENSEFSRFIEISPDEKYEGTSTLLSVSNELQCAIEETLSAPSTQAKSIGQKGGSLTLRGCRLEVPPKAYNSPTIVSISVTSSSTRVPAGCMPISPKMECKSERTFKGLVTITLPVHALPEGTGTIEIITKNDAESEWKELSTDITVQDRLVKFKVSHFTIFEAIIRGLQFWKTFLSHALYFNSTTSSLCVVTCSDSTSVIDDCHTTLVKKGFEEAAHPASKMAISSGNGMSYEYVCKTAECQLDPRGRMELTTQSFAVSLYHIKSYSLEPRPQVLHVEIRFLLSTPQIANDESVITLQWNERDVEPVQQLAAHQREDAAVPLLARWPNIQLFTREFIDAELNKPGNYHFNPHCTKGQVLIINNEFLGQGEAERTGSLVDVENLTNLCADLGLNVRTRNNTTADGMREACREFSTDAQNVNFMILVIMSHGGKTDGGEFFNGEDGNTVSSDEVISIFSSTNSPQLEGIPKVFVFQACRGDEVEHGLEGPLVDRDAGPGTSANQGRLDMLFVYPTQHGYAAFRNRINGSWLINVFVRVFGEHSHNRHVADMLTMVNREVSRKESEGGDIQRSNYLSFLRHDLYLFPGWPN